MMRTEYDWKVDRAYNCMIQAGGDNDHARHIGADDMIATDQWNAAGRRFARGNFSALDRRIMRFADQG